LESKGLAFGDFGEFFGKLELSQSLEYIWKIIQDNNKYIEENKPWELTHNHPEKFQKIMEKLLNDLSSISQLLESFMPETSEKIKKALETKQAIALFPRIK